MSQDYSVANNKRIAKNTLMLYFRMFFIMGVNLYTSRVVLDVLGVEDYGTYNVVGGVVTMLSFITASLGSATSRFITFELGKGSKQDVEKMFRCTTSIFYIFAIVALVFAETVGLWFVKNKLNIPHGREIASFWVYQFSVLTFIISIISISYNSLIIAKEKMSAFAYISIYDGLARLGILYLLYLTDRDRLIVYAALLAILQLSIRLIYTIYCKRNFPETNGKWLWDTNVSKKLFSYTGWSMTGHLAIVGYTQGLNILLNIYFGPVVNAARAIAYQVQTALAQFYANFQTAIKPQVIKSYAQGDLEYMHSLVIRTGRMSFMLAILVTIPVFTFAEYILQLWLVNPPEHVVAFVRLTLIAGISNSLSQHTLMSIHATGDIKRFQLVEGGCLLMILPLSWFLLKFNHVCSETVILVYVLVEVVTQIVRVYLVYPRINLDTKLFYTKILLPSCVTLFLCCIPAVLVYVLFSPNNLLSFLCSVSILVIFEILSIWICGIDGRERKLILSYIKSSRRFVKGL